MKYFIPLILTLLFAMPCVAALQQVGFAQTQSIKIRKLNKEQWEKLRSEHDYIEKKEVEKKLDFKIPTFGLPKGLAKTIAFTFIILLLGAVLYYFIKSGLFSKNTDVSEAYLYNTHNLEEKIHEADLDSLLKEALANKQYKHAVRIYYLICIKQLSDKNVIVWKKQKTNYEYLLELRSKSYYDLFFKLTRYYELVWYGDKSIDESEYFLMDGSFKLFTEEVKDSHAIN
jgi:hypothetical protein